MLLRIGVAMMALAITFAAVVAAFAVLRPEPPRLATAVKSAAKPATETLARSDPGVDPWVEKNVRPPKLEPVPQPEVQPVPRPGPVEGQAATSQPEPEPEANPEYEPGPVPAPEPKPTLAPEPEPAPEPKPLPAQESGWSQPTDGELEAVREPRRYDLPAGAIMGLTVPEMEIYDAPVFDSMGRWALANGVGHEPETSLPWSPTPERNVYLAGHRMGYSGTWSRMIFYHLDELGRGDRVLLEDRAGGSYEYRVTEAFLVDPDDTWVMGRVRGLDLLTLQTCTPIPAFDKRLIVRAERV